tara:strand:- start:197 stop:835 length:639 start_codon:yes stop_codon:yes gene_type:complete
MKTHLRHILSIGLLFAFLIGSSGAWAVDCPQNSYTLTTQAQVDAFPQDCDSVAGDIQVGSSYLEPRSDITDLVRLANLTSVGGDLYIGGAFNGNPALTNIDGLANLTSVGGDLYIFGNAALTNIDGLANLTSVGGDLYISFNGALTNCQGLAPVLGWPSGPPNDSVGGQITIDSNATGCNSVEEILASYSKPLDPAILWFLLRPTYAEDEDG